MSIEDFDDASFYGWLRNRGMSHNTARTYANAVTKIWPNDPGGWLQREAGRLGPGSLTVYKAATRKWIEFQGRDPTKYSLKGRTKKPKRKAPRPLTEKQLEHFRRLAAQLPEPYRTISLLLPATGLRISECCGLRYSQIERRKGRIAFIFEGKGEHERRVYLGKRPTRVLVAYLKANAGQSNTGWVFPGNKGKHVSPERVRQHMREISSRMGLHIFPHLLRHTYATNLHEGGNSVRVIQAAMGHANVKTTMRYIHPTDSELIAAADSIK